MKSFKDYFESPIPSGELYRTSKKSDRILSKKIERRITGKEPEKSSKQKYEIIKKEFLGALEDIKKDLQKHINNLDPKKIRTVRKGNAIRIDINQLLPKRYRKLDELLTTDFDFEGSVQSIENLTGLNLVESGILFNNNEEDEEFLIDLIEDAQKILNVDTDLELKAEISFDIEEGSANRTHFPGGIPSLLKNMGLGKKLYLAVAYKLKGISSSSDASSDAKAVWASMLTSAQDFYAFYNSKSTKRFILLKDAPDSKKKQFLKLAFEDIIHHYEINSIVNRTILNAAAATFAPGKDIKKLDQLFVNLKSVAKSDEEYKALKIKVNKFIEQGKRDLKDAESMDIMGSRKSFALIQLRKEIIKQIIKDSLMDKELKTFIEINFL